MQEVRLYTESMKDQIYEILKTEILNGELKSGEQLVEQAIANRFHASRSPVREAIMQLIGDGLVISIKNRGTYVKRPTAQDLREILEMRTMMDAFVIRKLAGGLTPESRSKLEAIRDELLSCRQNEGRGFLELERRLWTSMVTLAGNGHILDSYTKLYGMITNFERSVLAKPPHSFYDSIDERLAIIESMLGGDPDKAVALTESHALRSLNILCAAASLQE